MVPETTTDDDAQREIASVEVKEYADSESVFASRKVACCDGCTSVTAGSGFIVAMFGTPANVVAPAGYSIKRVKVYERGEDFRVTFRADEEEDR